jgi:levanase
VYGLRVLAGDGEGTVIGYDEAAREVFVDRTRSGTTGFSALFPSRERAPLPPRDGKVRMRVVVDRSSVEVFAGQGEVAITDLVFPQASNDRVELFREGGGKVPVESIRTWPLLSRPPSSTG